MKTKSPQVLKRSCCLGLLAIGLSFSDASGQGIISLQPFAEVGDAAPGTPDVWTALNLSNASLSDTNAISFEGTAGASGGGIWYGFPGGFDLAVRVGASAPGVLPATTFSSLSAAALVSSAGGGGTTALLASGRDGIWSYSGGTTSLVAIEGTPAPGTGGVFTVINAAVGNDAGRLAFVSLIDTAPFRAIYTTVPGSATLLVPSQSPIGLGGLLTGGSYGLFDSASGMGFNNVGRISFTTSSISGVAPANNAAVLSLAHGGGPPTLAALKGGVAPSSGGFAFLSFSGSQINDNNDVVFRATLDAGAPTTANTGLWFYDDSTTTVTKIAQEGDAAPGTANFFGTTFEEWFAPNDGAVAFVSGTVDGVLVSQGRGVWYDPDGPGAAPLELVAVVGGNAFDTDGTTVLGTVASILDVNMNRAGDMVLRMSLTAGGGTGLWVRSAGAGNAAALYLRTGDTVVGGDRTLKSITSVLSVETIGFTSYGGGPVGRPVTLSEAGEPLANLNLDGGARSGLYLPTMGSLTFFVAATDGEVPDGAGVATGNAYESIRPSGTINENGLTAFRGHLQVGVGDTLDNFTREGIWTEVAGAGDPVNTLVARRSDAAPVGTFGELSVNPVLNDNGQVAFACHLTGTTGTTGIFRGAPGSLEALAVAGQGHALLTNGEIFSNVRLAMVSLNNSGHVAALASLAIDPATMVTSSNDTLLMRFGTLPRLVAREGSGWSGSPAGVVFDDFKLGPQPVMINNNNHAVFSARRKVNATAGITSANQYGIWYHSGGATANSATLVATGGTLSGGLTLLKPEAPVLNGGNRVAFYSTLQGSPDTVLCLTNAGGGGAVPIVRTGVAQSDGSGLGPDGVAAAATFASLGGPVIGAVGAVPQVGFQGNLTVGDGGVTAADDSGVWVDTGAACRLVAREGAASPDGSGAPTATLFNSFSSISMGSSGRVAFVGNLRIGTGGVTAASDSGLWAENSSGALVLVVREGTSYTVPVAGGGTRNVTVRSISIPAVPGFLGGNGIYKSFSASGFLVGHLTFTDGTTGALVFLVP